jgi:hypothetical protein
LDRRCTRIHVYEALAQLVGELGVDRNDLARVNPADL